MKSIETHARAFLPINISAISSVINVQTGRKIRLVTTKGSYTKDKKHLPKHMWGLLFKPDACFMKYYM